MKKRVLITGGANGLGKELVKNYLTNGFQVTVLDLEKMEEVESAEITYHTFDLSKDNFDFDNTVYDVVICNAGISLSGSFTDLDFDKDVEVFQVNILGHMKLLKILLKKGLIAPGGRIVFINSATCVCPFPIALSYASSKAALSGFAQALEAYLLGKGISVTQVYPGPMKTAHSEKYYKNFEQNTGMDVKKVAKTIFYGVHKRKRHIRPDWVSKLFYLGFLFSPRLLCKISYKKYKSVCY